MRLDPTEYLMGFEEGRTQAFEEVERMLPLCKVCGGSHGKWVDANKLKQKLKEAQK